MNQIQTTPKVSVIIPTYNRWPHVCEAIDSVLDQTYTNTECIVVDDCSTDGSCERVAEKYGNRIKLLRNSENREKSYSRNYGTRASDADYVCYLDSDDLLLPTAVEVRMNIFLNNKLSSGVVYGITRAESAQTQVGGETGIAGNGSGVSEITVESYLEDANSSGLKTNSFLISREEMLKFGMYDEGLTNREDIELFIRLLCHLKFYGCPAVVSLYRGVSNHRARDNWEKIIQQEYRFSDSLKKDATVCQRLQQQLPQIMLEEHRELLRALYRGRFYHQYRRTFVAGFRHQMPPVGFKYWRRYLVSLVLDVLKRPG